MQTNAAPVGSSGETAGQAPAEPETPGRGTARALLLGVLALNVAAIASITGLLLKADQVVYDGTNIDDIGALDGLTTLVIVASGIAFGLLPLVVLAVYSLAKRLNPAWASVLVSAYTAACGVATVAMWFPYDTGGRRVAGSALQTADSLVLACGVVAVVPLACAFLARRAQGSRQPPEPVSRPTERNPL